MQNPFAERNQEIVKRRKAGETLPTLAKEYGVTPERIRQICARAARRERARKIMDNQALDKAIAETVMGWKPQEVDIAALPSYDGELSVYIVEIYSLNPYIPVEDWHPSMDLNQTFQVEQRMKELGWYIIMGRSVDRYFARYQRHRDRQETGLYFADNPATPILKASLEAIKMK